jgi:hypothetical protein
MLSTGTTLVSRSMPGLVVDARVEEDVAQDVLPDRGELFAHGQPDEPAPVVGHRAAAAIPFTVLGGRLAIPGTATASAYAEAISQALTTGDPQ